MPTIGQCTGRLREWRRIVRWRDQALALQFNLSETTFLFPSSIATAKVRIAVSVDQGELTGRRCKLSLVVDETSNIFVSGNVVEFGNGEIRL